MARFVSLLVLAAWLVPAPAVACTRICTTHVLPEGTASQPARLPVDAVAVTLSGCGSSEGLVGTYQVVRVRGDVQDTFTLAAPAYWPSPTPPAVSIPDARVDDRLTVTFVPDLGIAGATTTIHVMPHAVLPSTLGTLDVDASSRRTIQVDASGSCFGDLSASVAHYALTQDPAVAPWADGLVLTTLVDGVPWSDTRAFDPTDGSAFVFARCEAAHVGQSFTDVATGTHTLRIVGTIRGTAGEVTTNEVAFELGCSNGGLACSASAPVPASGPRAFALVLAALVALRTLLRRKAPDRTVSET